MRAGSKSSGISHLSSRRVYILPTGYGMLFALLLLLLLIGSINYANNLGFLLTFLLAGLGLVAMIHTWRNLLGLGLRAGRAEPVFAGQPACFQVISANNRGEDRPGVSFRLGKRRGPRSEITVDLTGKDETTASIPIAETRRGMLRPGRVTVSTLYPLGLFRAWSYVELDLECLIYPKPAGQGELPVELVYSSKQEGSRGEGADDFIGLRPYRPGDAIHHIDWKAFARERGLVTRQFGGDQAERVALDWDLLPGMDTEARLSLLCRFVLMASEQQLSFRLHLPGLSLPEGSGEAHRLRCLAALARFGDK